MGFNPEAFLHPPCSWLWPVGTSPSCFCSGGSLAPFFALVAFPALPSVAPRNGPRKKHLTIYTVCRTVYDVHYMTPGTDNHDLFENLRLKLPRGSLILAVLAALRKEPYGYTLRKTPAGRG